MTALSADPGHAGATPALSAKQKNTILAICCFSLLIVVMDGSVLNVALPSIQHDLNAPVRGLQWTVDVYLLVVGGLLILSGSTADRIGRRRVFQIGLGTFSLGSLCCSLAPSLGWLIGFRALQAIGGSMLNPVAMSIITNVFTEPVERARAIGMWSAVSAVSIGIGPVVGGLLTGAVGWRAIFWINVPIGLAAMVLAGRYVPESRAQVPRRPDPVGQLCVGLALGAGIYAIIEGPNNGWASASTLVPAAIAVLLLTFLVPFESRRRDPLIDPRFFGSVPFSGAVVIAISAYGTYNGFLFLNTLYLQDVRGLSPVEAGLCLLPAAVLMGLLAPVSGHLVGRRGPTVPLVLAGTALTLGMLAMVWAEHGQSWVVLFAGLLVIAVGFGLVNTPIVVAAVSGMPRAQAGVAAAVASTSRQFGGALGVAVSGAIVAAASSGVDAGRFADHASPAWYVLAGAGMVVLVLGVVTTSGRAIRSAERIRALFGPEELVPVAALDE